jgi:hypothetical protein
MVAAAAATAAGPAVTATGRAVAATEGAPTAASLIVVEGLGFILQEAIAGFG